MKRYLRLIKACWEVADRVWEWRFASADPEPMRCGGSGSGDSPVQTRSRWDVAGLGVVVRQCRPGADEMCGSAEKKKQVQTRSGGTQKLFMR